MSRYEIEKRLAYIRTRLKNVPYHKPYFRDRVRSRLEQAEKKYEEMLRAYPVQSIVQRFG